MGRRDNYSPDALDILSLAGMIFAVLSPIIWLATVLLGDPMMVFAFGGLIAVPAGILALARWLNHRHDPRYAKRPPDAP
jgi:hypothetical protein